jgi:hypothetical protein
LVKYERHARKPFQVGSVNPIVTVTAKEIAPQSIGDDKHHIINSLAHPTFHYLLLQWLFCCFRVSCAKRTEGYSTTHYEELTPVHPYETLRGKFVVSAIPLSIPQSLRDALNA